MLVRVAASALILLLSIAALASAYGSSVEDLVGSFSIGKTIKIGSSSDCFSSPQDADPLTPPRSAGAASALADSQPPSLAGLSIQPQRVYGSAPLPINLTAHIIDDQAVFAAQASFSGPAGQEATALFTSRSRISGTARDGIFEAQIILPLPASGNESINATGYWHLQNLTLVDGEGNGRSLSEADLLGRGWPTVIEAA